MLHLRVELFNSVFLFVEVFGDDRREVRIVVLHELMNKILNLILIELTINLNK